jgi:hypothetical protein
VPNKSCEINMLVKGVDFAVKEYAYKKTLTCRGKTAPWHYIKKTFSRKPRKEYAYEIVILLLMKMQPSCTN